MLAVTVAVKIWAHKLYKRKVTFKCDNEAVVKVINAGRSGCPKLLKLMRELMFIAAKSGMEVKAKHVMGKCNKIPDLLSRTHDPNAVNEFKLLNKQLGLTKIQVKQCTFTFLHDW